MPGISDKKTQIRPRKECENGAQFEKVFFGWTSAISLSKIFLCLLCLVQNVQASRNFALSRYTKDVQPTKEQSIIKNGDKFKYLQAKMGDIVPNFTGITTEGNIDLHKWLGNSWGILFSYPKPFYPICTTEVGSFAKAYPV